jgi:hypothetical protein
MYWYTFFTGEKISANRFFNSLLNYSLTGNPYGHPRLYPCSTAADTGA